MTLYTGVRTQYYNLSHPFRLSDKMHYNTLNNSPIKEEYNSHTTDPKPGTQINVEPTIKKDSKEMQQELFEAGIFCIYDVIQILEGE